MKKSFLIGLLALIGATAYATNLPISSLPLGTGSSVGSSDSFPYTNVGAGEPYRLLLDDLANIPGMTSKYAPLASPTFTGTLTTPTIVLSTGATTGYCWIATSSGGAGHWAACSSGSGTVTSVGLSVPSWLSVSGSPVTTSGTIAVTGTSESGNLVLASPNGSSGAVSPRALVAADLPSSITSNTSGTAAGLSQSLTSNAPLIGNGTGVTTGSKSGNTTDFATTTGSLTNGDCVEIDSNGNFIDAGAACGSGSGGTPGGSSSDVQYNSGGSFAGNSSFTYNGSGTVTATTFVGALTGHASLDLQASNNLSDVSSTTAAFAHISPLTTLGDILYENSSPAGARLAGNTSSTKKYLSQTGTGTVSAAPAWSQVAFSDLSGVTLSGNTTVLGTASGTLTSGDCVQIDSHGNFVDAGAACGSGGGGSGTVTSVNANDNSTNPLYTWSGGPITSSGTLESTLNTQSAHTALLGPTSGGAAQPSFRAIAGGDLPNPTATSLGGVESIASVSHNFLTQISTSGVPSAAQPAFTDISGSVAATQLPTATSSAIGGVEINTSATSHEWVNSWNSSGVPQLSQPAFSDISGTASATQLPTATTSAIGGTQIITSAVSNQWVSNWNSSGVPQTSQPGFTNLSGNLANSQLPTAETWPSSGTVQATTPNQYGVMVSGSGATATVLAPVSGTTKVLTSGGTSANPTWSAPTVAIGGQAQSANQAATISVPNNQSTLVGTSNYLIETGSGNLLLNPNFQASTVTSGWTTGGSGLAVTADTTNYLDLGAQSALLTFSSSTTGTFYQTISPSNIAQFSGVNMSTTVWIKTSLTTLQVCFYNGSTASNCQAVPATGSWQPVTINFIGPSSGSMGVIVETTGTSTTGTANLGLAKLERATNAPQLSQAVFLGDVVVSGCSSQWSTTSTSFGPFSTQTSCSYTVNNVGATSLSAPSTNLPAFQLSGAAGVYEIKYTGVIGQTSANNTTTAYFELTDGTRTADEQQRYYSLGSTANGIGSAAVWHITEPTAFSNLTFQVEGKVSSTSGGAGIDGAGGPGTFTITYYPTSQQQGYIPNATPASWSGYITCSSGEFVYGTNGSYTDPNVNNNCTLTQRQNRNFGSVSIYNSSGNLNGFTFTPPRPGRYYVCASTAVDLSTTGSSISGVDISDTAGTPVVAAQSAGLNLNGTSALPLSLCGVYNASSTSSTTLRMRGQIFSGSPNLYVTNGTYGTGIEWSIFEMDAPMPAPYLTGSITNSSTTAGFHHQSATISTSAGCTIAAQDTGSSWLSGSGTHVTGKCTMPVTAGIFNETPRCTCTGVSQNNINNPVCFYAKSLSSSTSVVFEIWSTGSSPALTDEDMDVSCDGSHN